MIENSSNAWPGYKGKIVSTLLFLSLIFFVTIPVQAKMLTINGDKVNLRTGPGKNYSVKWEYGSGFPLKVVGKSGKWIKVKDFEGDTGWVHNSLLQNNPQMIVKVNKGQDEKINIRNKPGTKNRIIGKAYYGVVFETLSNKSNWVKVKHESGLTGWIKRSLLWGY